MKLAIFGLTVSSSWGNGHATLWRGLILALAAQGHRVSFYERDVPWYADHRDLTALPDAELVIYKDWNDIAARADTVLAADALFVTSYCPDAVAASRLIAERGRGLKVFYDLDTPITLGRIATGEEVEYLPPEGLGGFDLVLSYTGGPALDALEQLLGARRTAPLYGHVDPAVHRPVERQAMFGGDLSYLGTYAEDRQALVERLFLEPARRRPDLRFVLGGSGYPQDFPWTDNLHFMRHVAPPDHPAFFCSSRATLNVTRRDMAAMGWCPSGRLFEAAACGAPILSDAWPGLDAFFTPDEEILLVDSGDEVLRALDQADLPRMAKRARERTLAEHSSAVRARELIGLLETLPAFA
jgi:spore maturation protein CgeB